MLRIITITILLFTSNFCFSSTVFYLPNDIMIDPNNPTAAFPKGIQQFFSISANLNNNECKKSQTYILTLLIYRNVVDNKIVSTYRAKNTSSLCWINLISYTDKLRPDLTGPGWSIPKDGENTWCSAVGLKNPLLCSIMSDA